MRNNDSQDESYANKNSLLKTMLTIIVTFVLVFGTSLGVYFLFFSNTSSQTLIATPSPTAETSPSQTANTVEDATGIGDACLEYLVVTGKKMLDFTYKANEGYFAAAEKTSDPQLKDNLIKLSESIKPISEQNEETNQTYMDADGSVYFYCINAGAFTDEDYAKYTSDIVNNRAPSTTPVTG